jgi:dUTP pyrophosphatase
MEKLTVLVKRTNAGQDIPLPQYMTPGAAGMDLFAAVNETLQPGEIKLVPTRRL